MNAFTVDEVFSKRVDLEDPVSKVWPSPMFLDIGEDESMEPRFQSLKDSLNQTKSSLNHLNLKAWHQHTCNFNSASAVMQRIKHHIKPELFTQAWVKMIEILNVYFPSSPESIKTLHICESPGAFISATNHHFQRIKWTWKALSLNPYYEGNTYPDLNNDDRHSRCNLSNWDYGTNNTGSVIEDIKGYFDILRDCDADLVTADGSINCLKTPNEQENMVLRLKTAEVILALRSLKIGGSFVIKFFTFFEPPTIKLLYLLNLCFDKISIFKPVASKEGNSEVYIILKVYNGKVKSYLSKWLQNYVIENSQNTLFNYESIPMTFKDWIYNSAVYFSSWQKKVIERNLISYNIGATEPKDFQRLVLKEFFHRYPLRKSSKKLKTAKLSDFEVKITRESKINDGNYEFRTQTISLNSIKNEISKYLERLHDKDYQGLLQLSRRKHFEEVTLEPVFGKPFSILNNSRFCCLSLIYLYQKTLQKCISKEVSPPQTSITIGSLNEELTERLSSRQVSGSETTLSVPCDSLLNRESSTALKKSTTHGLIQILSILRCGENIVLVGFPSFSRFYAGLLFILSHIFEEIVFIHPEKNDKTTFILLERFNASSHSVSLEDIYVMLSKENVGLSLLSIISIDNILFDKQFFEAILCFNYLNLVHRITSLLESIS